MSKWRDPKDSDYDLPPAKKPDPKAILTEKGNGFSRSNSIFLYAIVILLITLILTVFLYQKKLSSLKDELSKYQTEGGTLVQTNKNLSEDNQRLLNEIETQKREIEKLKAAATEFVSPERAITNLLGGNPGWRAATFAESKDLLAQQAKGQNPNYNPYYAEGDLNQDGVKDFAVVVVSESGNKGSIFWFAGTSKGYEVQGRVIRIEKMGIKTIDTLSLSIPADGELIIKDSGSNIMLTFVWDKATEALAQK